MTVLEVVSRIGFEEDLMLEYFGDQYRAVHEKNGKIISAIDSIKSRGCESECFISLVRSNLLRIDHTQDAPPSRQDGPRNDTVQSKETNNERKYLSHLSRPHPFHRDRHLILLSPQGRSGQRRKNLPQSGWHSIYDHHKIGGLILWLSPLVYLINPAWMAWSKIGSPRIGPLAWRWSWAYLCTMGIYWLFSSIGSGITPTSATRKEHKLVTDGPYRWVRHPLYTVGSSMFIAFGMMADNWFIAALGYAGIHCDGNPHAKGRSQSHRKIWR